MKSRPIAGRAFGERLDDGGTAPRREISTRAAEKGGAVADRASVVPENLLVTADDDLLFFIHGLANSKAAATAAYGAMAAELGADWRKRAVAVYWPADGVAADPERAEKPWLYPITSIAGYSWQPDRARESARLIGMRIAQALADRPTVGGTGMAVAPLRITIVAHSLGCRLALELLRHLESAITTSRNGVEFRLAVLMAAAVPLYLVTGRASLSPALATPDRTIVYHSDRDRALGMIFRIGQHWESVAPSWPFTPSRGALGRHGIDEVDGRREVYYTALDHGDYWPSPKVAGDVRQALSPAGGSGGGRLIRSSFWLGRNTGRPGPRGGRRLGD